MAENKGGIVRDKTTDSSFQIKPTRARIYQQQQLQNLSAPMLADLQM